MYRVNYLTGVGDFSADTLEEAEKFADKFTCYTQRDIIILDEEDEMVAIRKWWGCLDGLEDQNNPIQFGNLGYYSDWEEK